MIKEVNFDTWAEFEESVRGRVLAQKEPLTPRSLYRGHSDATWHLETTLDRIMRSRVKTDKYYSMIRDVQAEIETFTNRKWELSPDYELAMHSDSFRDYLGYLRHHSFPSPLLDWTFSPFVAAYFAFRELSNKAEFIAIYEYWQSHDGPTGNPRIEILRRGEYKSNKRHYLQQSVYTLCILSEGDQDYFANHEDTYSREEGTSDFLTKFILPASERINALLSLEAYNINAHSLMGSEESLLETVFLRYFSVYKAWDDEYPNWDGNPLF